MREQLNNGLIPDDIDVHCLAGLIKVVEWFFMGGKKKKDYMM